MSFFDPTDPMDFFLWEEFIDTDSEYECPHCGRMFGAECVAWCEENACPMYECPGCGCSGRLG